MDDLGLTRERLQEALTRLGVDLRSRGILVEIAIYGGTAMMMQFDDRPSTEDVDAIVRPGFEEAALHPSVRRVAYDLGLAPDWLNDAVGMFTPLDEDDSLLSLFGCFPKTGDTGLRVFLATPLYLLGLKLHALASTERGSRDIRDARALAQHLGVTTEDELRTIYRSLYGEDPTVAHGCRFSSVLSG